jgi:hypothetical protein
MHQYLPILFFALGFAAGALTRLLFSTSSSWTDRQKKMEEQVAQCWTALFGPTESPK